MSDYLIDDPELSRAYEVKNADDVEEAIEAVLEAEPRYYQSAQGLRGYVTDLADLPDLIDSREYPLGQPHVLDLAE